MTKSTAQGGEDQAIGRTVSQADKVSRHVKVAYATGAIAENSCGNTVKNMANPVLNMELGINPILVSLAIAIPRLWDAFSDPLMGSLSDKTRTRWGRRRPYILVGGLLSMVFMTLIWQIPQAAPDWAIFVLFLAMSLMFYTAFTVFSVPYQAMGFELTPDYDERTRVMAYKFFFGSISGVLMQWTFWLTQRPIFHNTVHGMQWVGFGIGISILLTALIPAVFVKERVFRPIPKEQASAGVVRSIRQVLAIKPFQLLLATQVIVLTGLLLVAFLGYYVAVYHIYSGDMRPASTLMGAVGSVYHLSAMVSIPLMTWLSTKIGKKNTMALGLTLALVGTALKWWAFNKETPYLAVLVPLFQAPGLSAVWTMGASMVADIVDLDELKSGQRRAGLLGACQSWVVKLGFTLPFVFTGFVLVLTGFDADLGGAQSEQTIWLMRLMFSIIPAIAYIVGILLILRFPITPERAREVRSELEKRRGPL